MSSLSEYTLPAGSFIHIGGIPFQLKEAAVVFGNNQPIPVVTPNDASSPYQRAINRDNNMEQNDGGPQPFRPRR